MLTDGRVGTVNRRAEELLKLGPEVGLDIGLKTVIS